MSDTDKTFRAMHRQSPVTPRKARYVVDLIRGKPVNEALDILRFCPRRAAPLLSKVVMSALATAQLDPECDQGRLHVVDVRADDGITAKRWTPRSRGQMYPLLLRYAHLTVVLGEQEPAPRRQRSRRRAAGGRAARVAASRAAQATMEPAPSTATQQSDTDQGAPEGSEGNG